MPSRFLSSSSVLPPFCQSIFVVLPVHPLTVRPAHSESIQRVCTTRSWRVHNERDSIIKLRCSIEILKLVFTPPLVLPLLIIPLYIECKVSTLFKSAQKSGKVGSPDSSRQSIPTRFDDATHQSIPPAPAPNSYIAHRSLPHVMTSSGRNLARRRENC